MDFSAVQKECRTISRAEMVKINMLGLTGHCFNYITRHKYIWYRLYFLV
jgi:hypothetical protein